MTWQRWRKMAFRFALLLLGVMILDGCLYRDPYVNLTGGCEIGAISPGSPCHLHYSGYHDPRTYSEWIAQEGIAESTSDVDYHLFKKDPPRERLKFDSVNAWRVARRERNARPSFNGALAAGVRGFKNDDEFIIGEYYAGFFVLDVRDN